MSKKIEYAIGQCSILFSWLSFISLWLFYVTSVFRFASPTFSVSQGFQTFFQSSSVSSSISISRRQRFLSSPISLRRFVRFFCPLGVIWIHKDYKKKRVERTLSSHGLSVFFILRKLKKMWRHDKYASLFFPLSLYGRPFVQGILIQFGAIGRLECSPSMNDA